MFQGVSISLQIATESRGNVGSNSVNTFLRFSPIAARDKIREISRNIESSRTGEDSQSLEPGSNLSRDYCQNVLNGNDTRRDNKDTPNDMDISSEFSFTSGYRSSELLSEDVSSEDLEEEVEKPNTKESIILEELPDLESINTQFNASDRKESENIPPRRRVVFVDEKEAILAASVDGEDSTLPVIRRVPKDFDLDEKLMKELHLLSERLQAEREEVTAPVTFVDLDGRVLAASTVKSPGQVRRKVWTSLNTPRAPSPEEEAGSQLTSVWTRLRKISNNLECEEKRGVDWMI